MEQTDYYAVLGLGLGASAEQIKLAYRRLARRYHPDRSTDPDAEQRFKEISEAHEALKRLTVVRDAIRQASDNPAFKQKTTRSADTSPNTNKAPQRGEDCEMTVQLSVEELYWGMQLKVNPAFTCAGRRGAARPEMLQVTVPRGTRVGQRLRLPGKGTAGRNGGANGDIYITIGLRPHPNFQVDGTDLYVDMPLSPWEATLGATVEVSTPGGRVPVEVMPGTSGGHTFRLGNRGLPQSADEQGDLFAVARIVSPAERARSTPHWPPRTPAAAVAKRWRPISAYRTAGNAVDIHC
jgi:curved DNA-binding protein